MKENNRFIKNPAEMPALVADGRKAPDRRQISARWLAGTILTGMTSCTLMGVALFAALDGREQLATPPQLLSHNELAPTVPGDSDKTTGARIAQTLPRQNFDDRRLFDISIVQKKGEKEIISTKPFELIRMALAEDRPDNLKYPKFNALTIFSDDEKKTDVKTDENLQIYGTKVESGITLRNIDFVVHTTHFDGADNLSPEEAEKNIQASGLGLSDNISRVAAQFGNINSPFKFSETPDVKIVQENVSVAQRMADDDGSEGYAEDIIPFRKKQTILAALNNANYSGKDVDRLAQALTDYNKSDTLNAGAVLRLGIETKQEKGDHLVRASIYNGEHHILSIALNDKDEFVKSHEPEMTPALKIAFDGGIPLIHVNSSNLPPIYDSVYQAVLSYDMPANTAKQLIRMLAGDMDLQQKTSPTDALEVFFAVPDKSSDETVSPEINYVSATFGGITHKYYRFQSKNGSVDYFDSQGRSSKQFLLRKPVPNGIFRSPFGARRHPVLGYVRMHTGVDWAAPRGSPIVAAGDGIVIKVGAMRGYGNHTEIQHANGYVTSYSHQNGFAPGIKPGVRVRQGQVIGYIGSTGLSTGPHCHFEVIVNGTKVDPMRIRLPDNKALRGNDLEVFKRDRDRINTLISGQGDTKAATQT